MRLPEFHITAPEPYVAWCDDGPLVREAVPLLWTLPLGRDAVRCGPGRICGLTLRTNRALTRFERGLGDNPSDVIPGAHSARTF